MIDTAEAVRLAAEALAAHEVVERRSDLTAVCTCGLDFDPLHFGNPWNDHMATAAVAAALPALAEQFAALIEGMTLGQIGMHVSLFDAARDRAARLVREAAEVTG